MACPVLAIFLTCLVPATAYMSLPEIADAGEKEFLEIADRTKFNETGMTSVSQSNPLQFPKLTDFWAAWELEDRPRKPALLIDDMQVEYMPYVRGIVPQTKMLIDAFRAQGLPIYWSTWWRWGPDDGYFNSMDRFYGPRGWGTPGNALYNHNLTHGGDVLEAVAPQTEEERRRVMHKSYSLDMFDERPMRWMVPAGQGTLDSQLRGLGVDTVVQVGAWTDDCIISTAFHAFSLQYDVVLIEDGVSTASKQHFNAIEVMRGACAKVMLAAQVADYIRGGLPVIPPKVLAEGRSARTASARSAGARAVAGPARAAEGLAATAAAPARPLGDAAAGLAQALVVALLGFAVGWLVRDRGGSAGVRRCAPAEVSQPCYGPLAGGTSA